MNNLINKFKQNRDIIFTIILSIISLIFIGGYMVFQKGITDLSIVLCYIIAIVLPMYNILNKSDDDVEDNNIDYLIASISSVAIIIYIIFSLLNK
ncbi:MAG: hypothetical protein PUD42_02205 [Clostridiales bacterium]|nr:hypothetical protein [Clostridiales bacterium]